MKRSIYIGLFLSVIIILFSSCLDSDDSRAQYVGICTVHQLGESDHYFTLDDGVSLYPQNQGDLLSFELKDRERVILNFDYVDSKVDGYDHSIKVAYIEKILTKDIITITPEMEDSIGNDQINITSYRLTKEYLTLEYQYFGQKYSGVAHMLNLVVPQQGLDGEQSEFVEVEFRHNAHGDISIDKFEGIVSFKVDNIIDELLDKKVVRIKTNTLFEGEKYIEVPLVNKD